ncbi:hypothetical protein [Streptomyces sp. NPDC097619]
MTHDAPEGGAVWALNCQFVGRLHFHAFSMTRHVECVAILEPIRDEA